MRPLTSDRHWLGRLLIGPVLAWNVQCAIAFLVAPAAHVPGFQLPGGRRLNGPTAQALVRGMAVLFLMWNVPYAVALLDPGRHCVSLYEAIVIEAIGLIGESLILMSFGGGHPAAAATLERFIAFDGAGLALLALAGWITHRVVSTVASTPTPTP